jgi:hypothetical protein
MPAAFFVVRATVPDPKKREAFDRWYQNEHLPDAAKSFGAKKAWRFWSLTDPPFTRQPMSSRTKPPSIAR